MAGLSMGTSVSSWFGMCMALGGGSADANAELKITDVCSMIKLHDIAVLTETNK